VTQFLDANKQPIKLNPGRTWVEFVPNGVDAEIAPTPGAPSTTVP
jgi:hypothetical protein